MRITRYRNLKENGYCCVDRVARQKWIDAQTMSRLYGDAPISRADAYRETLSDIFHRYTSYGCYPIVAVTDAGDCLCVDCAKKVFLDEHTDVTTDIYYEGPVMYCDECNGEIESAYGEPEGEA